MGGTYFVLHPFLVIFTLNNSSWFRSNVLETTAKLLKTIQGIISVLALCEIMRWVGALGPPLYVLYNPILQCRLPHSHSSEAASSPQVTLLRGPSPLLRSPPAQVADLQARLWVGVSQQPPVCFRWYFDQRRSLASRVIYIVGDVIGCCPSLLLRLPLVQASEFIRHRD